MRAFSHSLVQFNFTVDYLILSQQGVESSPSGISGDASSEHASSGDKLHSPSTSSHSGLPPLLPHAQWPVRYEAQTHGCMGLMDHLCSQFHKTAVNAIWWFFFQVALPYIESLLPPRQLSICNICPVVYILCFCSTDLNFFSFLPGENHPVSSESDLCAKS